MLPFIMGSGISAAAGAAGSGALSGSSVLPYLMGGGQMLGGMGQFISGAMGQDDRIDMSPMNKAWKRQRKAMTHQIRWRVKDAKKAGLHPLAALGVPPSAGPSATVATMGRGRNRSFKSMGQGLQQMMTGQSEITKAQIRNLDARTNYWNRKAAEIGRVTPQGQQQPIVDDSGVLAVKPFSKVELPTKLAQVHKGYEGGTEGFYKLVNVEAGGVQVFPNQALQETTTEGVHALEYGIKLAKQYINGVSFGMLNTVAGKDFRNMLRDQQRAVERQYGKHYEYDVSNRTWYPIGKDRNRLFTHRALRRFGKKTEHLAPYKLQGAPRPLTPAQKARQSPLYFD